MGYVMMKNGTCNHDKFEQFKKGLLCKFKLWKKENEDFPKICFFLNFLPKFFKLKVGFVFIVL
jgi:hypothetical protein